MLTYNLDERNKTPIYEYLYRCIRDDILNGNISPHEKLPSKRVMAKYYNIALITVENAYAQLQLEGYIYSKEKSGYFVNEVQNSLEVLTQKNIDAVQDRSGFENHTNSYIAADIERNHENTLKKIDLKYYENCEKENHVANNEDFENNEKIEALNNNENFRNEDFENNRELNLKLADFTSNNITSKAFPFSTWAKLSRRFLNAKEINFLEKPDAKGVLELRQAIAYNILKGKGIYVDVERIIIGPGTEYLHHIIMQLLGYSKFVAVEDPGYKKIGKLYECSGIKCIHIPVDQKGLVVNELKESSAGLVHISPAHHFPLGIVMTIDRRNQILDWAKKQNAYIIEDDYDSEFRFNGRPIPALASLNDDNVIYMNTFTKTLAPSIRIAYMVLPKKLLQKYEQKLSFYSGAVSSFEQYTLASFIKDGYYERHINRMRNYYRTQRDNILNVLQQSELIHYVSVKEENAGLHFILKINAEIDDDLFVDELKQKGIIIAKVGYYCYYNEDQFQHQFIINYGEIEADRLRRIFEIMRKEITKIER